MPPFAALPWDLCGHASCAYVTFLLPPDTAAPSICFPSPRSLWSPWFSPNLSSLHWAFLLGEHCCGHQKGLWAHQTGQPSREPAWGPVGRGGSQGPRAPCAPPPRPTAPARVHHSVLLGSHHPPDSLLSAQDAKANLPGCQEAAGAPHRPLPTPPSRPGTWHMCCSPVTVCCLQNLAPAWFFTPLCFTHLHLLVLT